MREVVTPWPLESMAVRLIAQRLSAQGPGMSQPEAVPLQPAIISSCAHRHLRALLWFRSGGWMEGKSGPQAPRRRLSRPRPGDGGSLVAGCHAPRRLKGRSLDGLRLHPRAVQTLIVAASPGSLDGVDHLRRRGLDIVNRPPFAWDSDRCAGQIWPGPQTLPSSSAVAVREGLVDQEGHRQRQHGIPDPDRAQPLHGIPEGPGDVRPA